MANVNILVLAKHAEILETMIRLINKNDDWNGIGVASLEQAQEAFRINKFDLVLLGVGVDDETQAQMLHLCQSIDHTIVCVRHFGGGSGLLHSEIQHALARRSLN